MFSFSLDKRFHDHVPCLKVAGRMPGNVTNLK